MILAHHMGEQLLPTLITGGASAVALLLFAWRVWFNDAIDRLRRR